MRLQVPLPFGKSTACLVVEQNLTQIHLDINKKELLTPELFKIWLNHFNVSVDENFRGEKAEQIKTQALNIATVMQIKIAQEKDK